MPSLTCAACSLLVKGDKDEGGGKEAEGRKQLFTLMILMSFDSQICLVFPNLWAEASVKAPPLIMLRPSKTLLSWHYGKGCLFGKGTSETPGVCLVSVQARTKLCLLDDGGREKKKRHIRWKCVRNAEASIVAPQNVS